MTNTQRSKPGIGATDKTASTQHDTTTAPKPKRQRRMARPVDAANTAANATTPSKLDRIQLLLLSAEGASIAELMAATGWQAHSVRGAIAGALRRRGLVITSGRVDGVRRYRAVQPA